ncbi:MAG: hypothetical protein M1150_02690 [Patescibacteria group bacterium]|nr:hypothetical protein [Patescibacteria group bacterium]
MNTCQKEINFLTSKVMMNRRKKCKTGSFFLGSKLLLFVLTLSIISLSLLQLFISNKLATEGEKIKQDEVLSQKLAEENITLKNDLQALGSLSRVAQIAQNQGFVKVSKVESLNLNGAVAALR